MLLDTHLVLWWLADDPKLSGKARELVMDQAEMVMVSQVSLWEVAIKLSYQRLEIDLEHFTESVPAQGFQWLMIRNGLLMRVSTLLVFSDHRDPFDRLLVAQSHFEPLILLTKDAKLERYGVKIRKV